jgi:crossover junction endodeoxyribonuclease RuvC
MRLLGVDPGSHKTGWGVIDVDVPAKGRVQHVDNGVLMLDDDRSLSVRLVDLCHRLNDVLLRYRPDCAAVEDVFVQKGARSALILGQARGAALATLGLAGLRVISIPTSQVKLRVTGQGRAEKAQVAEMVSAILGLKEVPFEDAADALAVALAVAVESPLHVVVDAARVSPSAPKRKAKGRDALLAIAKAQGKA